MLSRRELIAAGVTAGVATTSSAHAAPALEQQQADREGQREIARQVQNVEGVLRSALLSPSLAHGFVVKLRSDMEQFLRSNSKFPDFIEIGSAVFFEVYDWHVKHRQQLTITRADNRYGMQFMFTTLILRPEQDRGYIGIPFDKG
jgi:hypothetical protein